MSLEPNEGAHAGNLFLRLAWMFGGPMAIVLVAVTIAGEPAWQFSLMDGLFWAFVASVLGARVVDATRFSGLTADGEPTRPAHLINYGIGLTLASGLAWLVARSMEL
ncbi:hypothetical protein ACNOYE_22465 [Nannocystaceae bacterium ST9]